MAYDGEETQLCLRPPCQSPSPHTSSLSFRRISARSPPDLRPISARRVPRPLLIAHDDTRLPCTGDRVDGSDGPPSQCCVGTLELDAREAAAVGSPCDIGAAHPRCEHTNTHLLPSLSLCPLLSSCPLANRVRVASTSSVADFVNFIRPSRSQAPAAARRGGPHGHVLGALVHFRRRRRSHRPRGACWRRAGAHDGPQREGGEQDAHSRAADAVQHPHWLAHGYPGARMLVANECHADYSHMATKVRAR